ncbi:UDP binding domain-containing protein [Aliirhizobium terrae]|uniref:UDP binding domain-containing protein n=1 Tax=Terrirhizobium terrae TaxID=2926709 RepID=UPI003369C81C
MELIERRGGSATYFDPYVPEIPSTREYAELKGRRSLAWDLETISSFDAVVIATDHDNVDYEAIARVAPLIVDTRNVFARKGIESDAIVKA